MGGRREIPGGGSWISGRSKHGRFRVFSIKGDVLLTGRLTPQLILSFYSAARAAVRASAVPPSAVQRIEGERCLRTNAGDLKACTGAGDQVSGKRTRDHSSLLPLLRLCPCLHRLHLHRPRVCCTVSIPFASSSCTCHDGCLDLFLFVFLACVGFVDPSCVFGVLAYLFPFASSFSGIKLILDHVNFATHLYCAIFFSLASQPRAPTKHTFSLLAWSGQAKTVNFIDYS
jgi:hypothetical protein